MSIVLTVNGSTYDYPETGDINWGPDATDWAQAVTVGMLQKAGGLFQLLAEVDFGTVYGIKSVYYKTRTSNIADSGQFRLARADVINWRNQANSANLSLGVSASNVLQFNGTDIQSAISVSDTTTIDLTLTGTTLSADIVALSITNSLISASAAIAFSKLATLTSGNLLVGSAGNVATSVAMSGDATIVASGALTIANNAVTNAKMATMAQSTIKGRAASSGTGDPVDLTATQATAILNAMVGDSGSGGTKGLAPAPAAGDTAANKFLKADGTWTTPPGAGDVVGPASSVDGQAAVYDGTTGKLLKVFNPTAGSVLFAGTGGALAEDNANFFFDSSSVELGIGTNTPIRNLHIVKNHNDGTKFAIANNSGGNNSFLQLSCDSDTFSALWYTIGSGYATSGRFVAGSSLYESTGSGGWAWSALHDSAPILFYTTTSAIERMRIQPSGNVGIGATSPQGKLQVTGAMTDVTTGSYAQLEITDSSNTAIRLGIGMLPSGTPAGTGIIQPLVNASHYCALALNPNGGTVGVGILAPTAKLHVVNATAGVTGSQITGYSGAQVFIDYIGAGSNFYEASSHVFRNLSGDLMFQSNTSGEIFVGSTTSYSVESSKMQLYNSASIGGFFSGTYSTTDSDQSVLTFAKSASATIGTQSVLAADESIGAIKFRGSDGSAFRLAASITCATDGTPGASDMPGRLSFTTTPDGSASSLERLRITNAGAVQIGLQNAPDVLHRIQNSSTTNQTLEISNTSTSVSSDGIYGLIITKGSTTNTAGSNAFVLFRINAGSTQSGYIASNGANAAAFFSTSDARMKKDVEPLISPLDIVTKLKPVTFNWIEDGSPGVGFIAQEVKPIIPHAVHSTDDGIGDAPKRPWAMNETAMIPYLVGAIKELKQEIENLKIQMEGMNS